jgi:hypothetical protein
MAAAWKLTVRAGSRVEHERHDTLGAAADAARDRLTTLEPGARRAPARAFVREVAPADQVAARLELRGPGRRRGGLDLRGDGTVAAWTGRLSKRVVEPERGEDEVAALARALS